MCHKLNFHYWLVLYHDMKRNVPIEKKNRNEKVCMECIAERFWDIYQICYNSYHTRDRP